MTEPEIDMTQRNPKLSICEILRQIYWAADELGSEEIKTKAVLATKAAKKMVRKLREYKSEHEVTKDFNENVWEDNIERNK